MSELNQGGDIEHHHPHNLEEAMLIQHRELPRTTLSKTLDAVVDFIGVQFSWLWVLTMGFIIYSVVSRYAFAQGSVMLEEIQWHLAGAAWLVGLSYTLVHDMHVRVDVLHERFSLKTKTWIEMLGLTFLLLPFLVLALMEFIPYVASSYQQGEHSQAPNGLPYRWILKSFLPISIALLIVASVSRLSRTSAYLFNFPKPLPDNNSTNEAK